MTVLHILSLFNKGCLNYDSYDFYDYSEFHLEIYFCNCFNCLLTFTRSKLTGSYFLPTQYLVSLYSGCVLSCKIFIISSNPSIPPQSSGGQFNCPYIQVG